MSYPKWMSRSNGYEVLSNTAYVEHDGEFYIGDRDDIYRVDSWCEDASSGEMVLTTTDILDLPGTPGTIYNLLSAQGLLWITADEYLYSYNVGTDTLSSLGSVGGIIESIVEFNNEIHLIYRSGATKITRISKYNGSSIVLVWNSGLQNDYQPYPYLDMAVYGGDLYHGHIWWLRKWDGAASTIVHSFSPEPYTPLVGALEVIGSLLYIGTGDHYNTPPKLWTYNGAAVSAVCVIDPQSGMPLDFAYRSTENGLYVINYRFPAGGVPADQINLVDLTTSTSNDDESDSGGQDWALYYRSSDDTVWAGKKKTKVFVAGDLCPVPGQAVAQTYFMLA